MRSWCGARLSGGALTIVFAVFLLSCGGGGGAPTSPNPNPVTPPTPPPSSAGVLAGVVTEVTTGNRVPGATIALTLPTGSTTVTTNGAGEWEFTHPGPLPNAIPIDVSAPGYVTRSTRLRWAVGSRTDVVVDLIRESAPFSIQYYREFVRNLFEAPDAPLEPLRRWTQAPNFYIDTRNPMTGGEITQAEIDRLVLLLREAVPQLTGGRFGAGTIEWAPAERATQFGVINVTFFHEPEGDRCGFAFIGANPGRIQLNYGAREICGGRCGAFPWRTVTHEVGHTLGFWHVADGFVMNTAWFDRDCDKTQLSQAELHHAAVAYSRPPGNRDPDNDPVSTLLLQPEGAPIPISCR